MEGYQMKKIEKLEAYSYRNGTDVLKRKTYHHQPMNIDTT